jgi:hypothetical protein
MEISMSRIRHLSAFFLVGIATAAMAADEAVLLAPMPADAVRTRTLDWLASQGITDQQQVAAAGQLWAFGNEPPAPAELHERVIRTFGLIKPDVEQLLAALQFGSLAVPPTAVLAGELPDAFFASNLKAHVGRFFSQSGFYDEALELFTSVEPQELVDPAAYLFHRAVCEHRLLKKDEGLATLKQLLKDTSDVPVRYSSVAELMQTDLQRLKDKSLDEVSRMMSDVERRLGLGRGGARVQKVEEEIVARLDELIKKLEQQQGGGGGQSGNQNRSGSPASDSRIKGATAPGEVDERDIGHRSGWGELPPKQQTRARNLIDRELPPHYRSAIEQYLKKLAARPRKSSGR